MNKVDYNALDVKMEKSKVSMIFILLISSVIQTPIHWNSVPAWCVVCWELCKQFGPRSSLTKSRAWSGSKMFDTLMIFINDLKSFLKKDVKKWKITQHAELIQRGLSTSELRMRLAPWNRFKSSSKIFLLTVPRRYFFCGSFMFFLSCVCYAFVHVCLFVPCGHLLGKSWPLGSRLWCITVSLALSHWYPGSGVVFNCIDSWWLHPY